jgi:hypothetical protein
MAKRGKAISYYTRARKIINTCGGGYVDSMFPHAIHVLPTPPTAHLESKESKRGNARDNMLRARRWTGGREKSALNF